MILTPMSRVVLFNASTGSILETAASASTDLLLRTCHPALRNVEEVRVYTNPHLPQDSAWVLRTKEPHNPLQPLRIGGRPVYYIRDNFGWWQPLCRSWGQIFDPYWAFLAAMGPNKTPREYAPANPRAPLPPSFFPFVSRIFPGAVGLRVYIYGAVAVLYVHLPTRQDLAVLDLPETIAGMRYFLEKIEHSPTSTLPTIPSLAHAISNPNNELLLLPNPSSRASVPNAPPTPAKIEPAPPPDSILGAIPPTNTGTTAPPNNSAPPSVPSILPSNPRLWITEACATATGILMSQACIGLHLRLPSGDEVLTTTSHGFVPPSYFGGTSSMVRWVDALWQLARRIPSPVRRATEAVWGTASRLLGSTYNPVGKQVLMGLGSQQPRFQFGHITKSYDTPSAFLPYPFGYLHDLALISAAPGRTLPKLLWWSRVPLLTGFATFDEVLANPTAELFCVAPHLAEHSPGTLPANRTAAERVEHQEKISWP
ncbi:hypothetical protein B0H19DRAFT_474256 [Mycena capillaripes]|nr:hypothetical protein B0H19DRAFT_474256 [Mycena capillaripes]